MRIGELASKAGVSTKAICFYEFIGLLAQPERTPAGYRQYTQADAGRVTVIKTAQRLGMRLDEIRETLALRHHGQPPCGHVRQILRDRVTTWDQACDEGSVQAFMGRPDRGTRGGRATPGCRANALRPNRSRVGPRGWLGGTSGEQRSPGTRGIGGGGRDVDDGTVCSGCFLPGAGVGDGGKEVDLGTPVVDH